MSGATSGNPCARNGLSRRAFTTLALSSVPGFLNAAPKVTISGFEYMSLRTVASYFGMRYNWLQSAKSARLSSQWTSMDYTLHQRYQTLNGTRVYLGAPVALHRDTLHLSQIDYERTLQPLLTPKVFNNVPKLYHIVIDPGHGGKDVGAHNKQLNIYEKTPALSVSLRLGNALGKLGYKISYTRTNDTYLTLNQRSAFLQRQNADLFISVHFNATSVESVTGLETFVMTPQNQASTSGHPTKNIDKRFYAGNNNDVWNTLSGFYVQRELAKLPSADDRGLKRARFAVLREADCPAMLVEGGFISNNTEARRIMTNSYQAQLVDSLVKGVASYQRTLNRLRGLS